MNHPGQSPRQTPRQPLDAEVDLRRLGSHPYRVRLFDGSPAGCKIEFVETPFVGQVVWIRFDGLQPLEGVVRWVDGHYGGVQFNQPMYPSVFDKIAREAG